MHSGKISLLREKRQYQDEQQQEGREDECGEGVGQNRRRSFLWLTEHMLDIHKARVNIAARIQSSFINKALE